MPEELKVCPFCGGKAEIVEFRVFTENGKAYSVKCEGCRVDIGYFDTEAVLTEAWNKRPEPKPKENWTPCGIPNEAEVVLLPGEKHCSNHNCSFWKCQFHKPDADMFVDGRRLLPSDYIWRKDMPDI